MKEYFDDLANTLFSIVEEAAIEEGGDYDGATGIPTAREAIADFILSGSDVLTEKEALEAADALIIAAVNYPAPQLDPDEIRGVKTWA